MKKTAIALAFAASMGVGAAQAATLLPGSSGTITVTTGCFTFGTCAVDGLGADDITDNAITVGGIGSGIAADSKRGIMNFVVNPSGTLSLTSFSMDTYTGTAGGDFATRMVSTSAAGGTLDPTTGAMTLNLTGRTGIALYFVTSLGEQMWNLDNHTAKPFCPSTGAYELFTTSSSTAVDCATGLTAVSLAGTPLAGTIVGASYTGVGTIVSAGNVGNPWGFFDGTPYSEIYNVTVTGVVPVPAAVWLFGSGLLGLVGIARRKKAA